MNRSVETTNTTPIAWELEPADERMSAKPHASVGAGSAGTPRPRRDDEAFPFTLTVDPPASRRANAIVGNGGAPPMADPSHTASFGRPGAANTVAAIHFDRIMNTLTNVLLHVRPPNIPARPKRAAAKARSKVDIDLPLWDVVDVEYRPCAPAEAELPLPDVVEFESHTGASVDTRPPVAGPVEALPAHFPLIEIELPLFTEAAAVPAPDAAPTEPALAVTPHAEPTSIDAAEHRVCEPSAAPDPGARGEETAATAQRANGTPVSVQSRKRATKTGKVQDGSKSRPNSTRKSPITRGRAANVRWLRVIEQLQAAAANGTRPNPQPAGASPAASVEAAGPAQPAP